MAAVIFRAFAELLRSLVPPVQPAPAVADGPRPGDVVVYGTDDRNGDGKRGPGEIGHTGILSFVPGVMIAAPPAVVEARRWLGQGVYGLGKGGRNPHDGTPFDPAGRCDCSGFVCHCLGIDRLEDGRWWNTDSILRDGKLAGGRFEPVPLAGVDLRKCRAVHCHGGRGPAVSETSAAPWYAHGTVVRFVLPEISPTR